MEDSLARLHKAIDYLKDTGKAHKQQDIADFLGIAKSNLSMALKGNERYFTSGFLKRFADAYSDYINPDWLIRGEGRMEMPGKSTRPHYPAEVSAGALTGEVQAVSDYEVEYEPVIRRFPAYDFTIDVSGHSMEPTYWDEDIVACRRIYNFDSIRTGKAYVIVTEDGAVLKRILSKTLSSIRAASDNPAPKYKPYNINTESILSIYEVVGSIHTPASAEREEEYRRKTYLEYAKRILREHMKNSGN